MKLRINQVSDEDLGNLQKLIGGNLLSIRVEGGSMRCGDGIALDSHGLISMLVAKPGKYFKVRLKVCDGKDLNFYMEFYEFEWDAMASIRERFNPKTVEFNYDKDTAEDWRKYPLTLSINARNEEDAELCTQIKSIKIYHYQAKYDPDERKYWLESDEQEEHDFVAIIDIETVTGRRVIFTEDDPLHSYCLYIDHLEMLNYKLAEIHDDPGETFGKERYQLRHDLH